MRDANPFHTAAILYQGKIYSGSIHSLLFEDIKAEHAGARQEDCVEGFVLKDGRFLNRIEAKALAETHDLVRRGRDKAIDHRLWSEYLPEWALEVRRR